MLRSLQTEDPAIAWSRIHPHLMKLDPEKRISAETMYELLCFICRGLKAQKDTLHWAEDKGLLLVHFEDAPTSYSLTSAGRKWQSDAPPAN